MHEALPQLDLIPLLLLLIAMCVSSLSSDKCSLLNGYWFP
jgi:hypothetical protein